MTPEKTSSGTMLLARLRRLCRDIDDEKPLRRIDFSGALGPVLIGATVALSGGCDALSPSVDVYGAPPIEPEVCNDNVDNDRDGQLDCADPDCGSSEFCVQVYGVPMPSKNKQPPMPPPGGGSKAP